MVYCRKVRSAVKGTGCSRKGDAMVSIQRFVRVAGAMGLSGRLMRECRRSGEFRKRFARRDGKRLRRGRWLFGHLAVWDRCRWCTLTVVTSGSANGVG